MVERRLESHLPNAYYRPDNLDFAAVNAWYPPARLIVDPLRPNAKTNYTVDFRRSLIAVGKSRPIWPQSINLLKIRFLIEAGRAIGEQGSTIPVLGFLSFPILEE